MHLKGLSVGTKISVEPETGKPFAAQVRAIVPEENQLTRTRLVRFVPTENDKRPLLAANQSIRLNIPSGPPRLVTTAHKDALLHRRGSTVMFVFKGGKVSMRTVVVGQPFASRFEIVSGLEPGETVVTRGNERLRPGQEVTIRGAGKRGPGKKGDRTSGGRPDASAGNKAAARAPLTE